MKIISSLENKVFKDKDRVFYLIVKLLNGFSVFSLGPICFTKRFSISFAVWSELSWCLAAFL